MNTIKHVPQNSSLGIEASSNSDYLRQYREKRLSNPQSRIAKKLKLMTPIEVKEIEKAINKVLGRERLPDPSNPWYYDRRVNRPKVRKRAVKKPKATHPAML